MAFDRLPTGSWILVTGATGLAGSAIVNLLLQRGFCVRGVGRSALKAALFTEHLKAKYGAGSFEFAEVADFTASDAFHSALLGIVGIVHLAADTNLDPNVETEAALSAAAAAVLSLMRAAADVVSVKSFVFTSTAAAVVAGAIEYGKDATFSTATWQDQLIPLAKSLPTEDPKRTVVLYGATKVHAEREAWRFWNDTKPGYAFNTVVPVGIFGPVLNPTKGVVYSSHTWLNDLFLGNRESPIVNFLNPAVAMVDSRDCAAVHVAALLSSETNGQRLWASAHHFTANQILVIWRKAFPDRNILSDFDFPPHPKIEFTDVHKSTKLLKEFAGKDWYTLEESILANVESVL
ncbi:hypothetical protein BKA62DRAFT_805028 [Auriculariales sp. MPI-PUGE-AT-0066]|nr:hypothetical protein BKA62DRAFT_805028 [Auriculariales sp. MPI-PUGE-AT-0066]